MSYSPEIWRGRIERLGWGGHGLARAHDGRMLMLRAPLALVPGEEVEARVIWKARHGEGEVIRWITEDPRRTSGATLGDRTGLGLTTAVRQIQYSTQEGKRSKSSGQGAKALSGCPVAMRCGGCTMWGVDPGLRGELKREMVDDLLHRMLPDSPDWQWLPAPLEAKRSRIQLHWDGKELGYFARGTNELVPVSGCPMASDPLSAAIPALASALMRGWLPGGPERWELSTGTPSVDIAASAFRVTWRLPSGPGRPPVEDPALLLHRLGSVTLQQHPRAFFQVTPQWAWDAFGRIFREWQLGGTTLFDLYGGGGFFSRLLADRFRRFVLVETAPLAVNDARANLEGMDVKVILAEVSDGLVSQPEDWAGPDDTVLLDPPRAGLTVEVCDILRLCNARGIVLIGCDGAAFCRDVRRICEQSPWQLTRLSVVDLFPNTPEVECVGLLTRSQ